MLFSLLTGRERERQGERERNKETWQGKREEGRGRGGGGWRVQYFKVGERDLKTETKNNKELTKWEEKNKKKSK